jgi:omega-hydroxy-beta-dihydromenaquinone-9 sulfotransferase
MLKLYYRILLTTWETSGFKVIFLRMLFLPIFSLFTHVTLFLDEIFFSEYRKSQVISPVFIIGNPRCGSTFLHHLLTKTDDFVAFETWHVLFPALTARALVKPIVSYLIKSNRSTLMPEQISGSATTLDVIKTEEWLFLHKLNTQFILTMTSLAFDRKEHPEVRFHDQQSETCRRSSMKFFKGCLQRQMYYTGKKQIMAKMHFSTHRIKTLLEAFPDAKFIYLARSPYEVVPSDLSLNWNALEHLWGVKKIPSDKLKLWLERRYRYDIDLYKYFYNLRKNKEISEDNVIILRYDELLTNLYGSFEKIVSHIKTNPSDQLRQVFRHQAQLQKSYKRKHSVMKLEEFGLGLTKEKITKDFSFVFDEYNFDK